MMWGHGWGWFGGGLMMLIFWGGLIVLVIFALKGFATTPLQGEKRWSAPEAREILAQRFARGEISEEEFQQRSSVLERARSEVPRDENGQREARS